MIEVSNLTKKYKNVKAVDSISFDISQGEIIGFLGPNGAGKTTTMKIIACFMQPTSGSLRVAGLSTEEHSLQIRKIIGYLPESNPLYYEMGVIESLDLMARFHGVDKNRIKVRISEIVETCGLQAVIKKNIGELSRGYKQRVGLAQAIIHDPEILIMDEPTVGLDPNQVIELRGLINKLKSHKTVILSTHILSEAQATCDRIIIINKGKIVADGTKQNLHQMVTGKGKIYLKLKADRINSTELIANIPGVASLAIQPDNDTIINYEIEIEKGKDIREDLFHLAVNNNWVILEMHQQLFNLEDIFRKLTLDYNMSL